MLKAVWNGLLRRLMFDEPSANNQISFIGKDLSSTLDAIPDLMFELDASGRYWDFRALRPELLSAPAETIIGKTLTDIMSEESAKSILSVIDEAIRTGHSHGTQHYLKTPVGNRWFEFSVARKEDSTDEDPRVILLSRDITARKEKHLEIVKLAYTDPVTLLPNRNMFTKRMHLAIEKSASSGTHAALLFFDLDDFKIINDKFGHEMGDLMLKSFAERLKSSLRPNDLVARWGGDEFSAIIEDLDSDTHVSLLATEKICKKLVNKLTEPHILNGKKFDCHVSIGACLFNSEQGDIESILKDADVEMYRAKKEDKTHFSISSPRSRS